jgi:signal transduction histidine kinase
MQRRAEEVGGRCVIEPAGPGGGTRVRARLPLEEV